MLRVTKKPQWFYDKNHRLTFGVGLNWGFGFRVSMGLKVLYSG
jgi:hypothetical protein